MTYEDRSKGKTKESQNQEGITSKIKHNKGYMVLLIIILGLGHVLDEYSSLAPGMIKSSMIDEFFVSIGWKTQDEALQFMNLLGMSAMLIMIGTNEALKLPPIAASNISGIFNPSLFGIFGIPYLLA